MPSIISRDSDDDDDVVLPNNNYKNPDSKTREEEDEGKGSRTNATSLETNKSINEALRRALERAAEAGAGDEEPEVLPPPSTTQEGDSAQDKSVNSSIVEPAISAVKLEKENLVKERSGMDVANDEEDLSDEALIAGAPVSIPTAISSSNPPQSLAERAAFIPLRLTYEERKSLRLVTAAINVSDYSNAVDIAFKNPARRQHTQLQHIVAFLTGLVSAIDYSKGQTLLEDRNFEPFEKLVREQLEIARRYKITNPEKLRSEYGKLIYLMQDSVSTDIKSLIGVGVHAPIRTVRDLLEKHNALKMLHDPLLPVATEEILPDKSKSRSTIQSEIRRKEKAAEAIVSRYSGGRLSSDAIRLCMYSIGDNNSFLNSNRKPVVDCIALLHEFFSPKAVEEGYSLAISEGVTGARLTHSHEMQFNYVNQSLTLWAAILQDMFRLWYLAEQDLLSETQAYELRNTGQGLQRVQQSPRVFKAMHEILASCQRSLGGWVGTSVVHLGDHNVPNALVFIDKYTQVARILGPLVTVLTSLDSLCSEDEGLERYLRSYGGIIKAKKDILHDFFTHGFDGSGGDNFFDAGSCIDGRLTSAWNWCSQLAEKPYYPLFKLTGFLSFDGQFEK